MSHSNPRFPPPPGILRNVGGSAMHAIVSGQGGPTVVLESGAGGGALGWQSVTDSLRSEYTVVSRDRPGFGWSEYVRRDRTAVAAGRDLHELLLALDVPKPYVLVGHSLGGLHVRAFASLFPQEVCGLVLVDPSHEQLFDGQTAMIASIKFFRWLILMRPFFGKARLRRIYRKAILNGDAPQEAQEVFDIFDAMDEAGGPWFKAIRDEYAAAINNGPGIANLRAAGPRFNFPVRIISQGRPSLDARTRAFAERMRIFHEELISLSEDSKLIIAEKSGHLIPMEQPELVVETIRELCNCKTPRN